MSVSKDHIRNFSIIAHIDHGKSTLADRLLELTSSVAKRDMQEQILDDMELERERGITIKAHAVKLDYTAKNGEVYEFNLIDTPGHVDFNYEVSRSLAACEGAILIVDASQGVEAQTLANTYLALDHDLDILPVINKIDLPAADPDRVAHEVEDVIGIPCMDAPRVSAKTGQNVEEVLEYIVNEIKPPQGDDNKPLKALIFDSVYDSYRGVIVYVRIMDGKIKAGDTMRMMATGAEFTVVEVGYMRATSLEKADELCAGEVGYITASIKTVGDARVGDTVTLATNPAPEALPGYRKVNPMVFCGVYPADGADYENLRDALEKLQLNDASLSYEPETSGALGFGFRCGFLGLLHLEIIQERLEREYNLDLITTVPSVVYKIHMAVKCVIHEIFLSQSSKIVPVKTASLRYAVCGCCLCIKNANCYRKKRHQFASSKTSVSSTVCPLGMWYFTAGRWTLVKYRLVLGSQPMTTASPLPRTAQHRVSQWASAVSFSALSA